MQDLEEVPQFEPYHLKSYKGRNTTYRRWSAVVLPNWKGAACMSVDPELFFVERYQNDKIPYAKSICMKCPLRTECLMYSLEHNILYGIWGGATPKERKAMAKLNKTWRAR